MQQASPHHLIVGGQRSGKSRQAERLALQWLQQDPAHRVTVVATAEVHDEEMRERIARHRAERPSGFATIESPLTLAQTLRQQAAPTHLLLVDCLTLWLTNWLMPHGRPADPLGWQQAREQLVETVKAVRSPVILVSNEVGWGLAPLGREVRDFVDELGRLNQAVAPTCGQLTLMVAGQPWTRAVETVK